MLHKGLHFRWYHPRHCYTPHLNLLTSRSMDPRAHRLTHVRGEEDLLECWNHHWMYKGCRTGKPWRGLRNYSLSELLWWTKWEADPDFTVSVSRCRQLASQWTLKLSYYSTYCIIGGLSIPNFHCLNTVTWISHYLKVAFKEIFVGMMDVSKDHLVYSSYRLVTSASVMRNHAFTNLSSSFRFLIPSVCFSKDWVSQASTREFS